MNLKNIIKFSVFIFCCNILPVQAEPAEFFNQHNNSIIDVKEVISLKFPLALTFIGDSLTYHNIYPKTANNILWENNIALKNYTLHAYPSKTAKYIIDLITSGNLVLKPTQGVTNIAFLMIGTNGYHTDDLINLISIIKAKGYIVIVLTPPPRRGPNKNSGAGGPGSNRAYTNWIRSNIPEISTNNLLDVQYIDVEQPLLDPHIPLSKGGWLAEKYNKDNVHLNTKGYELVGRTIAQYLLKCNLIKSHSKKITPVSSAKENSAKQPTSDKEIFQLKSGKFMMSGFLINSDADKIVKRKNDVIIFKKGTSYSTATIRFNLDKSLPPGLYKLSSIMTIGGLHSQTITVKLGTSMEKLRQRMAFRGSNKKSWKKFDLVTPELFAIYPGETILEVTISGKAAHHKVIEPFKLEPHSLFSVNFTKDYGQLRARISSIQSDTPTTRFYILESNDILQSEKIFQLLSDIQGVNTNQQFSVNIINKEKSDKIVKKYNLNLPALIVMNESYATQNILFSNSENHLVLMDFMPQATSETEKMLDNYTKSDSASKKINYDLSRATNRQSNQTNKIYSLTNGISSAWLVMSGWAGKAGLTLWGLDYESQIYPSLGDRCPTTAFDRIELNKRWRIENNNNNRKDIILESSTPNCTWGKGTAYACLYLKSESATESLLQLSQTGYLVFGWLDEKKLRFDKAITPNNESYAESGEEKKVTGITDQGGSIEFSIEQNSEPIQTTLNLSKGWHRLFLKFVTQQEQNEEFSFNAKFLNRDGTVSSNLQYSITNQKCDINLHKEAARLEPLIKTQSPINLLAPTNQLNLVFDLRKRTWRNLKEKQPIIPTTPFKAKLLITITDYDGKKVKQQEVTTVFPGTVAINMKHNFDCGYYAIHFSLYTVTGKLIISYPPDGFSVIRGTAAQQQRKKDKKVATTYYYLADGNENKIYFPWMQRMGIYMNIGSSPSFPIDLAESAKKAGITLVADFYDKYSQAKPADKLKLVKKAVPYTKYFKSYNEIDHHKELRMTPEKWVAREKTEYEFVQKACPDGFYVGGSLVYPGTRKWFIDCLRLGIDKYHDAWDIHAYPDSPPVLESGFGNSPAELIRGINLAYKNVGRTNSLPFWIGETGARASHGIDARRWQADMISKIIATSISLDTVLKVGFLRPWYFGRSNDGVHNDITTAHMPGDAATYTAVALIDGFPYKRLNLGENIQAAKFGETIMLWTLYGEPEIIKLALEGKEQKYYIVDVVGRKKSIVRDKNGTIDVQVSESPIYVVSELKYNELTR